MTLRLPASANADVKNLANQLKQIFARFENPLRPTRLVVYADVASLPPASEWENCIAICADVGASARSLIESDGTNWRRCDTLATL